MPAGLEVVFFCNSGSEANDLALRLACAAAPGGHAEDVIVMDHAYHGHTSALIGLSPYKFSSPGGLGKPAHVHVLPVPDQLRGPFLQADPAGDIARAIKEVRKRGSRLAAFFCESVLGCAGQIMLPPGYLAAIYPLVREAGGVCVADEVQTGFGRVGEHYWAFQSQGVVPDVVTLGKPMGNGFPLAAVVTTHAMARTFHNGMEYFNTFGGSNLACAVGLEVMQIIEDEKLQENALRVGNFLISRLRQLSKQYPFLGHVRGMGLFIGVEVVVPDHPSQPHARNLAEWLCSALRSRRVLVSTDGPQGNVLKMKPPLCFSQRDAAFFLGAMGSVLAEDLPAVKNSLLEKDLSLLKASEASAIQFAKEQSNSNVCEYKAKKFRNDCVSFVSNCNYQIAVGLGSVSIILIFCWSRFRTRS